MLGADEPLDAVVAFEADAELSGADAPEQAPSTSAAATPPIPRKNVALIFLFIRAFLDSWKSLEVFLPRRCAVRAFR